MSARPLVAYKISFQKRILQIDPVRVSSHTHASGYFAYLQKHIRYYLTIYCDVLERVLARTKLPKEQLGLLDVGCGNGLLGLFARHCGFGNVLLMDAHPDFVEASRNLANELGLDQCLFVEGKDLSFFTGERRYPIHAVVGTDVIEHIYDLDFFLSTVKRLNPSIVCCFTTAANPANWIKRRSIRRQQRRDEYEGFDGNAANGEPPHPSFRSTRETFLKRWFDEPLLSDWVDRTRGKTLVDVEKAVLLFEADGSMLNAPDDPFNTCDPVTGSWTERLLPFHSYQQLFEKQGWSLRIECGYYDTTQLYFRSVIYFFLNGLIFIFGKPIAPFLFLCASTTSQKSN
jgi:SAM-dependent methyltransferase